MEKAAREEVPLGRKNTNSGQSVASEILEQKRKAAEGKNKDDLNLPTFFKRLAILNREGWVNYSWGALFACCA